jgi:hypothetical protein
MHLHVAVNLSLPISYWYFFMKINVTNTKCSLVGNNGIHNIAKPYKCGVCDKHVLNVPFTYLPTPFHVRWGLLLDVDEMCA